jgi:hypothetical protein
MSNIFDRAFFTEIDKSIYETISALSVNMQVLENNIPYIMMRVLTLSSAEGTDTFVLTTSAHSHDTLAYTADINLIDLLVKDGGEF